MLAHRGRLEGTTISCDNFSVSPSVTHYFLSHGHSDHCSGLTPSWKASLIYCTRTTMAFIRQKYSLSSDLFAVIEEGQRTAILLVHHSHTDDKRERQKLTIHVTAIPAHHCLGAVMFLFEGYFGRILYSGDFRFCLQAQSSLDLSRVLHCDRLYMDDTYGHPKYDRFLSRDECATEMRVIIESEQRIEECRKVDRSDSSSSINNSTLPLVRVLIGIDTLGKEELLICLSLLMNTPLCVSLLRLKTIQVLCPFTFQTSLITTTIQRDCESSSSSLHTSLSSDHHPSRQRTITVTRSNLSQFFVTDPDQSFIYAMPKQDLSMSRLIELNSSQPVIIGAMPRFIAISPSGWSVGKPKIITQYTPTVNTPSGLIRVPCKVFRLPYSLHSSFSELIRFVQSVRPRKIIPITTLHFQDRYFRHLLCKQRDLSVDRDDDDSDDVVELDKQDNFEIPFIIQRILKGDRSGIAVHHLQKQRLSKESLTKRRIYLAHQRRRRQKNRHKMEQRQRNLPHFGNDDDDQTEVSDRVSTSILKMNKSRKRSVFEAGKSDDSKTSNNGEEIIDLTETSMDHNNQQVTPPRVKRKKRKEEIRHCSGIIDLCTPPDFVPAVSISYSSSMISNDQNKSQSVPCKGSVVLSQSKQRNKDDESDNSSSSDSLNDWFSPPPSIHSFSASTNEEKTSKEESSCVSCDEFESEEERGENGLSGKCDLFQTLLFSQVEK